MDQDEPIAQPGEKDEDTDWHSDAYEQFLRDDSSGDADYGRLRPNDIIRNRS